jgi:hypothetical protein
MPQHMCRAWHASQWAHCPNAVCCSGVPASGGAAHEWLCRLHRVCVAQLNRIVASMLCVHHGIMAAWGPHRALGCDRDVATLRSPCPTAGRQEQAAGHITRLNRCIAYAHECTHPLQSPAHRKQFHLARRILAGNAARRPRRSARNDQVAASYRPLPRHASRKHPRATP